MKVHLHEIKEEEKTLIYSEKDSWVSTALNEADEDPVDPRDALRPGHIPVASKEARTAQIQFRLQRVDELFTMTGDMGTYLRLVCSRCAEMIEFPIKKRFQMMYSQDKDITRVDEDGVHGIARHAHDFEDDEPEVGEITYLYNDFIDLSDVLLEQLVLQIPMQPLCEMGRKGEHCQRAKIDLDRNRIVNEKLATTKPFSVLKNFKIKGQ